MRNSPCGDASDRKAQGLELHAVYFEGPQLFQQDDVRVARVPVAQNLGNRSPATAIPPKPNRLVNRIHVSWKHANDLAIRMHHLFHAELAHASTASTKRAFGHMIRLILFVTTLTTLVHLPLAQANSPSTGPSKTATPPESREKEATGKQTTNVRFDRRLDISKLPHPVAEMLDAIQLATASGLIEDLQTAIEWNELPPTFSVADGVDDPVAYLKSQSDDGKGRQLLAVLAGLLSVGPARQPLGRDPENTDVYIWPYLAERPLDQLSPQEEVDLYRLVPVDQIKKMRETKRWTWYRLVIGADGTWHAFTRAE